MASGVPKTSISISRKGKMCFQAVLCRLWRNATMKRRTQESWCISKMPSAKEHGNFLVRTVDTDVIVSLVGQFHELKSL